MAKRVLSVLLSVALLLCVVPLGTLPASAETSSDYTYTVSNGEVTITGYTGAGGDVVIPSTLGGYPVTGIGSFAFEGCSSLASVTIPDSVTSIVFSAFSGCGSLTDIMVDENNATYASQDGVLFNKAKTMLIQYPVGKADTAYTIPDSVTSIERNAFCGCTGLTSVTIPDGVTGISMFTFSDCSSLTSVTIPDSMTFIGWGAFYNCSSLTDVWYGGTEEEKAQIEFAWDNEFLLAATWHYAEEEPNVDESVYTYTVTDGEAIITGYTGAGGDVVIPSTLGGYPVTSIGYEAFAWGFEITSVTIPKNIRVVGEGAFRGCRTMTSVILADGVTHIENQAFEDCEALTEILIPSTVIRIGDWAFYECTALTDITVHEDNTAYCSVDGVLFDKEQTQLLSYPAGKTETAYTIPNSVTNVYDYAFGYSSALTSIALPNGLTRLGRYAFVDCCNLSSISIPADVTEIGENVFMGCENLLEIRVDSQNGAYHSIDGVLFNQEKTELLAYPAGKMNEAYVIPDGVVTIASCAFQGNEQLVVVSLPNSVQDIGYDAFSRCVNLETINIPEGITTISSQLFWECERLSSVVIPASVTDIEYFAFGYCSSLTSVMIPDSVTSIGEWAFCGCSVLTEITLPSTIAKIGYGAFASCNTLLDVWYGGSESDKLNITIDEENDALLNATWHYAEEPAEPGMPDDPVIDENSPTFVVDDATARAGDTFTVAVRTENNTGITSLKLLVEYDGEVLELQSITQQDFTGGVFGTSPLTDNPFTINWADTLSPNNTTNGTVALLTFKVKDGAAAGSTAISLSYDADDVYDVNYDNVTFATVDGTVNIIEYISGDVNGDTKVNNKDLGMLLQYLNNWDVEVVELACDVNRDGKINNKDLGILLQYLNNWDVELK